ncbi:helix-turn-helix domain-containing protein [Rhodococcus erythropolis]|nr:helix-turn-helix domain-containing protein [Rhodococcus erythropolis]
MPLRLAHRIEWDLCISLRDLTTIHTPRQAPRWPDRSAGLGRNGTSLTPRWVYRRSMESDGSDRLLTIPEAYTALRISRTHFFRLMRNGVIVPMRLGHRVLIPQAEIRRLIEENYRPPRPSADG